MRSKIARRYELAHELEKLIQLRADADLTLADLHKECIRAATETAGETSDMWMRMAAEIEGTREWVLESLAERITEKCQQQAGIPGC
jgi:phage host-nuclease inhibitor protein Gam